MKLKRLLILLFFPVFATGQTGLSLKEAMDRALQNNLEVRLARNNAEAAEWNNHPGVAGALPTVNLSGGDVQQSTNIYQKLANGTIIERDGAAGNTMNGALAVSYTLFNGYRISATRERLARLQEAGDAQLLSQIQSTLAAVIGRYYDVQRQEQVGQALTRSRDFVAERVKVLETRARVGLANDADLFQARIDLNAAEQALSAQQLAIRQAKLDLSRLLAVPGDSTLSPTDSLMLDQSIRQDSVRSYLQRNPDYVAAGALVVINEQLEREINAQRLPSLRLNGGYNFQRSQSEAGFSLINQSYGPNIGLSLQVPIYNGGAFERQHRVAKLQTENARIQQQNVEQGLLSEALKTYAAYRTALEQVGLQEENEQLSRRLLDILSQRFATNQATVLDLRAAQASYEATAASLANVRYTAKLAETELKRLMNRLPE